MNFKTKLEQINKEKKEICNKLDLYGNIINNYSKFDAKLIGNFLANYLSELNDCEFQYHSGYCMANNYRQDNFEWILEKQKIYINFITTKENLNNIYKQDGELNYTKLSILVQQGQAFILNYSEIPNLIQFYEYDKFSDSLYKKYNLGENDSLINFIDYIISTRIENNIDCVTDDILKEIKENVINSKVKTKSLV